MPRLQCKDVTWSDVHRWAWKVETNVHSLHQYLATCAFVLHQYERDRLYSRIGPGRGMPILSRVSHLWHQLTWHNIAMGRDMQRSILSNPVQPYRMTRPRHSLETVVYAIQTLHQDLRRSNFYRREICEEKPHRTNLARTPPLPHIQRTQSPLLIKTELQSWCVLQVSDSST